MLRQRAKYGATLVYISTDYVFNGDLPVGQEWQVDDQPDPQSEYGRTKRLGEEAVEKFASSIQCVRLGSLVTMAKLCLHHAKSCSNTRHFNSSQ